MEAKHLMNKESDQGKVCMTIYSPDTVESNLCTHIEEHIKQKTDLLPFHKVSINIGKEQIKEFYSTTVSFDNPLNSYIQELFSSRESVITFWYGENAFSKMHEIKGKSHPAKATDGTIRSKFWCDNKICNLMHSSDNAGEMQRELNVLNINIPNIDYNNLPQLRSNNILAADTTDKIATKTSHSGIIQLAKLIDFSAVEIENQRHLSRYCIPTTDSALVSFCSSKHYLDYVYSTTNKFTKLLDSFWNSDIEQLVFCLKNIHHLKDYQRFVITCSSLTLNDWLSSSGIELAKENELHLTQIKPHHYGEQC